MSSLIQQLPAQLSDTLNGIDWAGYFASFKEFMIIASIILGFFFVIVVYKLRALVKADIQELIGELHPPQEQPSAHDNRWAEIRRHLDSVNAAEWKFALIEADKLFDEVLREAGYEGETMGERLLMVKPGDLPNLNGFWEAHKIRNRLVHDVDFVLYHSMAMKATNAFEDALRELGSID